MTLKTIDKDTTALAIADERRLLIQETEQDDRDAFIPRPPRYKLVSTAAAFEQSLTNELEKTLTGTVIAARIVRAFWEPDPLDGAARSKTPLCSSTDGRTGVVRETEGEAGADATAMFLDLADPGQRSNLNPFEAMRCDRCPLNQWGSGKQGRGKACKEMRRLLLIPAGQNFPALLSLPPTSVANWDNYATGCKTKGEAYFSVKTKIAAEKTANDGGIEYSKVTFARAGELDNDELRMALALRSQYESIIRAQVEDDEVIDAEPGS